MAAISNISIRRINLFGGPSAGKSTIAADLFSILKRSNEFGTVELVREYVKAWAYQKRIPQGFDQHYIFGKQLHAEETALRGGAKLIVTDSPIFLSYIYSLQNNVLSHEAFLSTVKAFNKVYPSINVFVRRGSKSYDTTGRFHTLEESLDLDSIIEKELIKCYGRDNITYVNYEDFPQMGYPKVLRALLPDAH